MKAIFILLMSCLFDSNLCAQINNKEPLHALYLGSGGQTGINSATRSIFITWMNHKSLGYTLQYQNAYWDAINLPGDYKCRGIGGELINCSTNDSPKDLFNIFALKLKKQFFGKTKYFRVGLEAGPSFVFGKETEFISLPGSPGAYYTSNEVNSRKAIGLSMAAKLEFPLLEFMGLELGLDANINTYKSILGITAFFNLGLLRIMDSFSNDEKVEKAEKMPSPFKD